MAPGLARKVLIFAAVDGLVLQPLGQRGQRPISATKITYKDNHVGPFLRDGGEGAEVGKSFEAFGVIGKPEESILALCAPLCAKNGIGTVRIFAYAVFYRSTYGFKVLFLDIYNWTTAGCADTRTPYLCGQRSRPDSVNVSV
jgi:hypothetical protein